MFGFPGTLPELEEPEQWVPPEPEPEPTSRYVMPAVPSGHDWMVALDRNEVVVSLRRSHKTVRTARFQYSPDDYINAALAVDTAHGILRQVGPLRQLNLTCLENFSAGPGVFTK